MHGNTFDIFGIRQDKLSTTFSDINGHYSSNPGIRQDYLNIFSDINGQFPIYSVLSSPHEHIQWPLTGP